jgi:hypothetical protein
VSLYHRGGPLTPGRAACETCHVGETMRIVPSIVALALAPPAWASSGPWVPGPGETQMFLGGDAQRFGHLRITGENGDPVVLDVDEGISAVDLKAIASYGILGKFELEATLPIMHVYANRSDGATCEVLGPGSCATTDSIGILVLRGKGLLLDELAGSPITMALGAELRHGAFTFDDRERVTNTGEGTFDTGGFVDIGRVGGIGSDGSWAAYMELGGRYRFPNTTTYESAVGNDQVSAPGAEWFGQVDFLVSPTFPIAFGPEITGLWRPTGLAWYELDLGDVDRFAALKIALVRAGGKVIVRNRTGTSFVVSALGTLFAWNNPSDIFLVSAGIGFPIGKKEP